MVTIENVHAIYVKLENRPGTLERAARVLQEKRVNIDSIGLETVGALGVARILTQRPREAIDALRTSGFEAYESEILVTSVPNRIGELHKAAQEIASAGINVEGLVTTADGRLAIRTSDNERAAQILRKL